MRGETESLVAILGRSLYKPVLGKQTPNFLDLYSLTKVLGQGQFGVTSLCIERVTGKEYACKTISKRKLVCQEDVNDVKREIQIMHHIFGHPNIVAFKGAYEDATSVHLVMELCMGGELFERIVQIGYYTERKAAQIIRTIVSIVEFCHSLGVMHRDLKPENFLLSLEEDDAPLKAIDFGLSTFFKPGEVFHDIVGSPYYVAPEVLARNYGPEADVWSAGVILYILLSGVPPFWAGLKTVLQDQGDMQLLSTGSCAQYISYNHIRTPMCFMCGGQPQEAFSTSMLGGWMSQHYFGPCNRLLENGKTEKGIFDQVLKGDIDFESDPWPQISDSAKNLIRKMMDPNPRTRYTAHQVLSDPWICKDGVAPDRRIDSAVLSRMKRFSAMNKMKKIALRVIAERVSEEQIAGLKKSFMMLDTDNSGTITFEKLKSGLEKLGSVLMDSEIRALMEAADFDKNGYIEYGEFLAATLHLHILECEENLFAAFSYFDKDNSGYITVDELQQACLEYNMHDVQIDELIQEIDQDNDGRIDFDEFASMMRRGNSGVGEHAMKNNFNLRDAFLLTT